MYQSKKQKRKQKKEKINKNYNISKKKIKRTNKKGGSYPFEYSSRNIKRVVIYKGELPHYHECGGHIVLHSLIKLLNKKNVPAFLYSQSKNLIRSKYNPPITDYIDDYTAVIYPEGINGNPKNAKHVFRWILYDPIKRGGQKLIDSYKKTDVIISYGNYCPLVSPLKCDIELSVADFNENQFIFNKKEKSEKIKTKKYYLVYKARMAGWTDELLNKEIN